MHKIFTVYLIFLIDRVARLLGRKVHCALLLVLLSNGFSAQSQNATFSETFDDTPFLEVPEGWKWYSLGGGGGINWVRSSYGLFGPLLMTSGAEYAVPGEMDEDWLVTPQITPAAGDHLIFDSGQEYVWDDYGSTFHVLISTATSNRGDFTNTLGLWTEPEFPGYPYEERLMLDLSAYAGIPIYIAFVHKNPVTGEGADPNLPPPRTENWYLDNVEVRPVLPLAYTAGEIFGSYTQVTRVATSKTSIVVALVVRTSGDTGDAKLSSMTFTTAGSSPRVKIKEAILYTTYDVSFVASNEDDGIVQADVYGKAIDPGASFTIYGDQLLERGDTYFWLFYTLEADDADLTYPYPEVDATMEKLVVNDVEHSATVPSTQGSHAVVPQTPINDNYANAIELAPSAIPTRYGSYNTKATFETELEKLAYCATPVYNAAMDGSNSVWWHFQAPSEGMITVDLSNCNFNTLLLIQDENWDQLACSKDIDEQAHIFQSKITGFPVEAGKDYYIRVTGEGLYPGDPNTASGVVHMDFSFTTPTGIEEAQGGPISGLYPNPAGNLIYADLVLSSPSEVVISIADLMGRPILSENKGVLHAGVHEKMPIDISNLSPGTYMLWIQGSSSVSARKMVVVK